MSISNETQVSPDILQRVFRDAMRKELIERIEKDLRPHVEAAADACMASLNSVIEQRMDPMMRKMLTNITLRWAP